VNVYGGFPPLIIRAAPDGTVLSGGDPVYSVTVLDEDLFWMSSGFETVILRGFWYPSTIASLDRESKIEMKRFYEISGADMSLLPFSLHDFGGRGVSCGEQAEVGGAAHLVNYMGSDTVEGVLAMNFYYDSPMSAFSVFATEHSVECSFGLDVEGEGEYIRAMLANAVEGTILSIVIDGKDTKRCAERLCAPASEGGFREAIIASKAKVVFRPDSGDMMEIVPWLIRLQAKSFGTTTNAAGYLVINHVGIIQGDGVDRLNMLTLIGNILAMGFVATSVVFGSGGSLLQKVNRDTLKWAQKGSAILVDDTWVGIAKDPITDPGKKSKEGVMTTIRNIATRETKPFRLDTAEVPEGWEDVHRLALHTGRLYNKVANLPPSKETTMAVQPISPQEALDAKITTIPDWMIETVNEMLTSRMTKRPYITLLQKDICNAAIKKAAEAGVKTSSSEIYAEHWMDFEPFYEKAGWKVAYDKPAYCETYEANFTFTKKD